jgi:nucleolar protein 4
LPARNGKPAPPRLRGFAFVWFTTKSDAEKAIAGANGKPITRAQGKSWKSEVEKKKGEERVIAVDWALSKEKWREAQGEGGDVQDEDVKMEGDEGVKEEEEEEADEEEDSEEGSDEESAEEESGDEDDEEEQTEEDEEDDADPVEGQEPVKPTLPTVDVGSTLFVRNLPFEVTEQELNSLYVCNLLRPSSPMRAMQADH